jgi:TonB family protein
MRINWTKFLRVVLTAVSASLLFGAIGMAQQGSTDEGKRRIKTRVSPAYPELARRMNVSGKVKIEVVIAPDGRVRSTRVIGGHPLLVQAAQDAVKEWKFSPAPEETTQIVEFSFQNSGS